GERHFHSPGGREGRRPPKICARLPESGLERSAISMDGVEPIMKRQFVAGVLGLALAGCAQSRSAVPKGAAAAPDPVSLTPIPSIHDTINRGTGDAALTQTALKDPADPRWNGRAPVSIASRSGPADGANPVGGGPPPGAPNAIDRPPAPVAERDLGGPPGPVA